MAHRRSTTAAIAAVMVVVGVPVALSHAGSSGGIPAKAIGTTGRVLALAADGPTVAAIVGSTKLTCDEVVIWNVRDATPTVLPTRSGCPSSRLPLGGLSEIAVGGEMVGVVRFGGDHTVESVLSVTRLPSKGALTDITGVYEYEYGAGEGDYLSVLGDGSILAFSKWSICYVYNQGDTCPGVPTGGGWWVSKAQLVEVGAPGSHGPSAPCPRLSGQDPNNMGIPWRLSVTRACREIRSGASPYRAIALDRGRFVVLPPRGRVTIVNAHDGSASELSIPTSAVAQADLDGTNLVLLRKAGTGTVLEVHDAATGSLRRTWPLTRSQDRATGVRLEDVHAGIAVYLIGTTIHLLRMTDGRSHTITVPVGDGPVHARLENPGLSYSFNVPGVGPRGRLEFVPFADLVSQLG